MWPIVERIKDTFQPDFIVVQCGVDGLAGDPMATWNWSIGDLGSLGWCVDKIVQTWPGKKLLLGGGTYVVRYEGITQTFYQGGYNSPNAARAWTFLTSVVVSGWIG